MGCVIDGIEGVISTMEGQVRVGEVTGRRPMLKMKGRLYRKVRSGAKRSLMMGDDDRVDVCDNQYLQSARSKVFDHSRLKSVYRHAKRAGQWRS